MGLEEEHAEAPFSGPSSDIVGVRQIFPGFRRYRMRLEPSHPVLRRRGAGRGRPKPPGAGAGTRAANQVTKHQPTRGCAQATPSSRQARSTGTSPRHT